MSHPCSIRGDAARARLAELDTTQSALALALDVDLRTIQRWFAGGRTTLENAEAVAAELGVGTAELFDGAPLDRASPFAFVRGLAAILGRRDSPLVQAATSVLEHFSFIDEYISFAAHPPRGYVRRIGLSPRHARAFVRFDVHGGDAERITFAAQIARHLRYAFGEVRREHGRVALVEYFHTRTMRAPTRDDGGFVVEIWVPREMRELVVVADRDVEIVICEVPPRTVFDLDASPNRYALCFRPSPTHLRDAGLAPFDDRIRGDRSGRVDVMRGASPGSGTDEPQWEAQNASSAARRAHGE